MFKRPKRRELFNGEAYSAINVAADDSPRRFTLPSTLLHDAVLQALDHPQAIGDFWTRDLVIAAGEHINLLMVDVGTLYVENATPGNNGTLAILGSRY